ncbi:MAG: hypothetical protein MUC96_09460 [Myxococcaceae bacterium]|jgi:hypothetical protein|nr:hypothetical protein [Myxococcaceae bacterium]
MKAKKKSLEQQHRGGLSNLRGNAFEEHFAVWRCLEALHALEQTGAARSLATQLRNAFVDDWVEKHGVAKHHYQLKRKASVSWSEVAADFRKQLKHSASATLVVHQRKTAVRLRRSKWRVRQAAVLCFPGSIRPGDVMKAALVAKVLHKVCVVARPTRSDLSVVWAVVAKTWKDVQNPGRFVHIERVVDRLTDPGVPVRVRWTPTPKWARAEKWLSAIGGLSFSIDGGHFHYDDGAGIRGRVSCRSSAFAEFVELVVQGKITKVNDVGVHL